MHCRIHVLKYGGRLNAAKRNGRGEFVPLAVEKCHKLIATVRSSALLTAAHPRYSEYETVFNISFLIKACSWTSVNRHF